MNSGGISSHHSHQKLLKESRFGPPHETRSVVPVVDRIAVKVLKAAHCHTSALNVWGVEMLGCSGRRAWVPARVFRRWQRALTRAPRRQPRSGPCRGRGR
eukprot:135456-Chlamydomonas_euryale.AAC.1